jgi:hypothetical protein
MLVLTVVGTVVHDRVQRENEIDEHREAVRAQIWDIGEEKP